MPNKIVWEKWIDPFLSNLKDVDATTPDDDVEDEEDDDEYLDTFQQKERSQKMGLRNGTGPVMIGPMGIIPINEHNTPSKIYCFWMGHTNFSITKTLRRVIEKVAGVETLDVFTRYRFRVAVGKAFLDEERNQYGKSILMDIEEAINKAMAKPIIKQGKVASKQESVGGMSVVKKHLAKKYPFWAIFKMSDGTFDTAGAKTKEEVLEEVEKRHLTPVATSWDK